MRRRSAIEAAQVAQQRAIVRLFALGASVGDLVLLSGCSVQQIEQWIREAHKAFRPRRRAHGTR